MIESNITKKIEKYLLDYITTILLYNRQSSFDDLKTKIKYYLDANEYISDEELKTYLDNEYSIIDNKYYILSEKQSDNYVEFLSKYRNIEKNINESINILKINLNNYTNIHELISLLLIVTNKGKKIIEVKSKCFNIYKTLSTCENMYNQFINELNKTENQAFIFNDINYFSELPIIPQTNYQKRFLKQLNITKFKDINNLDFNQIIALYIENPFKYLKQLNELSPINFNIICNRFKNEYINMTETQKTIFKYRIKSTYNEQNLTLQELGKKLNITRERVRQVEKKIHKKISGINIEHHIIKNIFNYYDINKYGYLSIEKFTKIFCDENIKKYFIIYTTKNMNSIIKTNLENSVIYNSDVICLNKIIDKLNIMIPNVISIEKYNRYSTLGRAFIDKNYKLTNKKIYLKKGNSESDTYLTLLDDLFPNGYRISSDEDFDYLILKYREIYGTELSTSKRNIAAKLDRSPEYCLCDRGTYIKRSRCSPISNELLAKIVDYIKNSKYTVYYSEILNKFRMELVTENIKNQFLLKGLLDSVLPKEFYTNRDCIMYGNQTNKWDAIITYMRNQKGIFNLNDINFEFPDISYTILQGIISNESNNHNLLILYDKKFIYADQTNIDILKPLLKTRIEKLLNSLNSDFITSHKLFANIALSEDNIFDKVSFEVDEYNTYSIVKYLYPNEYFYKRPIISKSDKGTLTTINIIHDYLIKLDSFDDEISSRYITKMNLSFKWIHEYQELCNYMSNEFLQINKKTMIKKENLNIDSYTIEKIDGILNNLIERYKELNITDYNAYFIFPNINNLKWNEYMIIGFINSYLYDKYEFYIQEGKYYIRRLNYEL